eukprot:5452024-Prymnesium_polylepis.1
MSGFYFGPPARCLPVVWGRELIQGRVPGFDSLHCPPLGAHTSAPLLVSFKENEAGIIPHRVSCLDF